jgi:hypothetical protein
VKIVAWETGVKRSLGIGAFEDHPLSRYEIKIRGKAVRIPHEPHAVGASGIHGDENNIGGLGPYGQSKSKQEHAEEEG